MDFKAQNGSAAFERRAEGGAKPNTWTWGICKWRTRAACRRRYDLVSVNANPDDRNPAQVLRVAAQWQSIQG